uniref:Retrotransposon gag domain-containing protein n=1 Tax=Arundo donax TaxID=35708 RepID=A0A0A8ZRY8_ARUDO
MKVITTHSLKCPFQKFERENPRIWRDKCVDYFHIFNIHESMWVTAASLHMEGNATKWFQVYKLTKGIGSWFIQDVEHKFGANDYRRVVGELLELK